VTVPPVTGVQLGGDPTLPLLVLGPSLGTSVQALWGGSAQHLSTGFHVVGWDLPGHGRGAPATGAFTMVELAEGVLALVDRVLVERGEPGGWFCYAGVSVAGAAGLQVLLDHPGRITAATLLSTGAVIGTPQGWSERAALVRSSGTPVMVESSARRWFAPGFIERQPAVASGLLSSLLDADPASYAWACEALGGFDVRDRLRTVAAPVLAVAGALDDVTPVPSLREIADGVAGGRLVVLDDVAHLAAAEAPAEVAGLVTAHVHSSFTAGEIRAAGMAVRRAVLGPAHVDRATADATELTRDFQNLITQYAWGSIWTRPGLDRRSRSLITLTALVARGHHEELALHLRAARANGVTDDEIKELLLQTAIYCGVPDANTAFRIAQRVLAEPDERHQPSDERKQPSDERKQPSDEQT
jgi:3-oxoadipate enol-lactonase / 4-carboxymuconolactone decarboxylase